MEKTDRELIEGYRKGDTSSFEMLFMRHRDTMFGLILGMTGNRQIAEEIFQETWLKAIKKISRYKHKNFKGWLSRIARNLIIDRARKKTPELILDDKASGNSNRVDKISSEEQLPPENVTNKEIQENITRSLSVLPLEQREVFLMRVEQELTFREIAKIQGTSINTALGRMQYAAKKMKKALSGIYENSYGN